MACLICKDCVYWNERKEFAPWGICSYPHTQIYAYIQHSKEGAADFLTKPDFGCVLWSKKE